jgi:hypothetical protein
VTPEDQQAIADLIVLTIKGSLGPILERIAAIETQQKAIPAVETSIDAIRDRVLSIESKTPAALPDIPGAVASILTPFAERIASTEAKLGSLPTTDKTLTELRDRLVAIETKAGMPPAPDPAIGELRERLSAVETKSVAPVAPAVSEPRQDDTRDRVLALETKSAQPLALEHTVTDLRDRFDRLETRLHDDAAATTTLRERIAVLETRAPMPGPTGPAGKDGADGKDGKDGTPGLAGLSFEGVYQEGKSYDVGNLVTWAGSSWHCNESTRDKPGEGSKAWTLMVKRGRDGKDGRDAVTVPVVSLGGSK